MLAFDERCGPGAGHGLFTQAAADTASSLLQDPTWLSGSRTCHIKPCIRSYARPLPGTTRFVLLVSKIRALMYASVKIQLLSSSVPSAARDTGDCESSHLSANDNLAFAFLSAKDSKSGSGFQDQVLLTGPGATAGSESDAVPTRCCNGTCRSGLTGAGRGPRGR